MSERKSWWKRFKEWANEPVTVLTITTTVVTVAAPTGREEEA